MPKYVIESWSSLPASCVWDPRSFSKVMADPTSYSYCESESYVLSFNYYALEVHETKKRLQTASPLPI